jgi:uncharacterized membrane protein YadS
MRCGLAISCPRLLAPVVATISIWRRMAADRITDARRPSVVPLFVLGFVACVAIRSTGLVPADPSSAIFQVQTAALFAMGAGVRIAAGVRRATGEPNGSAPARQCPPAT